MALQIRHTQTPVACTLDTDLPTDHRPCTSPEQSGEELLKRQPTCLRQKYSQSVKDPCPLRTISLKVRFPPERSPWFVLPTNFGSVTPAEGPWKSIATPPSAELQTFAFVKIDLGSCNPLVLDNRLFHSLYIQAAGYKDCDVISERGNPCRKRASKRDTAQGRTCPLIPKPAEEGLQREDIEKRRQRAVLPDRTLDREYLRTPSVHLHHCCGTSC